MLEELRSLNEAKKKQVLIIATIIIMAVIVGVWVAYFNSTIMGAASVAATVAPATAAPAPTPAAAPSVPAQSQTQASGPGLWQNIESGFGSAFSSFANMFSKPSQYNIQPQGN